MPPSSASSSFFRITASPRVWWPTEKIKDEEEVRTTKKSYQDLESTHPTIAAFLAGEG